MSEVLFNLQQEKMLKFNQSKIVENVDFNVVIETIDIQHTSFSGITSMPVFFVTVSWLDTYDNKIVLRGIGNNEREKKRL